MNEQHEMDEHLELLYHLNEKHQLDIKSLREHKPDLEPDILEKMKNQKLIQLENEQIHLTPEGFARAEQIIRRHRLAERLLHDVLHLDLSEMESGACEFEHIVAEEITESICVLLGHPRTCPHGSPIPEGNCCRKSMREVQSVVIPLVEVPVGTWARIAYINSVSDERQHRLSHLGIMPGQMIKLHQLKPSVVVALENTRVAMEKCIAQDIYVWKKWIAGTQEAQIEDGFRFWKKKT